MLREHASAAGDSKFQTLGKRHLVCVLRSPGIPTSKASGTSKQGEGKARPLGLWRTTIDTGLV